MYKNLITNIKVSIKMLIRGKKNVFLSKNMFYFILKQIKLAVSLVDLILKEKLKFKIIKN